MKKPIIFTVLAMSGLLACNQNAPDNNSQSGENKVEKVAPDSKLGKMEDQVMSLHEKTMHDMDSLVELKKDLKALRDSKAILTKPDDDSIDANIHRLQKSDDDMMDWMNNYNEPDKKMAEDKALAYVTDQLNKIESIYGEMQQSMIRAREFLKEKK